MNRENAGALLGDMTPRQPKTQNPLVSMERPAPFRR
jgi:hypothetical protein